MKPASELWIARTRRARHARRARPWSVDILPSGTEAIPKGLNPPAQGCAPRATLGVCAKMNPQPCKGCITAPTGPFSPPCRNHWPGFSCIPSSPPKTAVPCCATPRSGKNYTTIWEAFSSTWIASPSSSAAWKTMSTCRPGIDCREGDKRCNPFRVECVPASASQGSSRPRNPGLSDLILSGWSHAESVHTPAARSESTPYLPPPEGRARCPQRAAGGRRRRNMKPARELWMARTRRARRARPTFRRHEVGRAVPNAPPEAGDAAT
jgi:hypothetical protein